MSERNSDTIEQTLRRILGVDDETLVALRQWLAQCEQCGASVDYDKIGQWLANYKAGQ